MDIASMTSTDHSRRRSSAPRAARTGLTRMWSSQIFGPDTLTVFAVVGREYPDLDLGTAVVPIQTRHPTMLAAQARTVQEAIGGRLSLGIGLSHKAVSRACGHLVRSPGELHGSTSKPSRRCCVANASTSRGASERGHDRCLGPGTCELRRSWWRPWRRECWRWPGP